MVLAKQQRLTAKVQRLENKVADVRSAAKSSFVPTPLGENRTTFYKDTAYVKQVQSNLNAAKATLSTVEKNAPFEKQKALEKQNINNIVSGTDVFKQQYQALLEAQQLQTAAVTAQQSQQQSIYDRLLAEQQRQEELQKVKSAEAEAIASNQQRQAYDDQQQQATLTRSRVGRSTAYRSIYAT